MIIQLRRWDLLLLGMMVSPIIIGGLLVDSMYGLLTAEVTPADQQSLPSARPGDRVEVYGTWVRDTGHLLGEYGWNELHPAVFLRNLDSGLEGGNLQCMLLEGVHDPGRLEILDPAEPCKWARGVVRFVFIFADGDLHLDLELSPLDQFLANGGLPLVALSYPLALTLVEWTTAAQGALYLGVSLCYPHKTLLGRVILRLAKQG